MLLLLLLFGPLQIWEAALLAGTSGGLVYARIDPQRFAQIYTAKGRWSLIEDMAGRRRQHPPAATLPQQQQQHASTVAALSAGAGGPTSTLAGMDMEAVKTAIRETASNLLGVAIGGRWLSMGSVHALHESSVLLPHIWFHGGSDGDCRHWRLPHWRI